MSHSCVCHGVFIVSFFTFPESFEANIHTVYIQIRWYEFLFQLWVISFNNRRHRHSKVTVFVSPETDDSFSYTLYKPRLFDVVNNLFFFWLESFQGFWVFIFWCRINDVVDFSVELTPFRAWLRLILLISRVSWLCIHRYCSHYVPSAEQLCFR